MRRSTQILLAGLALLATAIIYTCWLVVSHPSTGPGASLGAEQLPAANGQLAFLSSRGITLVNADGSNLTTLVNVVRLSDTDSTLAWSPDGTRLVLAYTGVPQLQPILVVYANSGRVLQLTDHGIEPVWAPDSSRLAFRSCCEAGTNAVVIRYTDSFEQQVLTASGNGPAWSPNGARFAFYDRQTNAIMVGNPDGSRVQPVTQGISGIPVWSPDSTQIAFVDNVARPRGLYVIHADGSGLRLVTTDSHFLSTCIWSPDGAKLACSSWDGDQTTIFVVHSDGSQRVQLARGYYGDPVWSPDSTRIAFSGWNRQLWDVLGSDPPYGAGVFVINTNGSGLIRLTSADVEVGKDLAWSPDGRFLAFTGVEGDQRARLYRQADAPTGVYLVTADGSMMARLADEGKLVVWRPERPDKP